MYGGSFDPVHYGHVYVAQAAVKKLGLNALWILVNPQNPFKREPMLSLDTRAALCVDAMRGCGKITVKNFEQEQKTTETYATLRSLRRRHRNDNFVWIMGIDNAFHFHKWRNWREIVVNHEICFVTRGGIREISSIRKSAFAQNLLPLSSSRIRVMRIPSQNISSTEIRSYLKQTLGELDSEI